MLDLITSTKSAYCFSVNFIGCRSDALHSKTQFITRLSLTIRVWETLGSPFKLFNSQMSKNAMHVGLECYFFSSQHVALSSCTDNSRMTPLLLRFTLLVTSQNSK
ncbi:putative beta-ketoacyl synthase [Trichinella spiralis]|uniref:putative beta-ketoacyl synthase n=1 Tax=Trichinella spiralis TaxID=6334 RepID=UPI0001EFCA54|nr:putative beta-ketoacyl synthase [Trichinella spiralis]